MPVSMAAATREIVGPHIRREAVRGGVGEPDGLGLVIERRRNQDRPEDLLAEHLHRLVNVADHRRLEEVPGLEVGRALPAGQDRRALLARGLDVSEHALVVLRVDQRP
jgi:hypothetical protein